MKIILKVEIVRLKLRQDGERGNGGNQGTLGRKDLSGEERCESECVRKQMFPHSTWV